VPFNGKRVRKVNTSSDAQQTNNKKGRSGKTNKKKKTIKWSTKAF
jgi:hypothetical protein